MRPAKRTLKAVFALALTVYVAVAESRVYQRVGASRGLDARVVADLLIDHEGFLWVASREGLFRYDGYHAESWKALPGGPDTVSGTDMRCLYEADDGTIWIGTNTSGLNRFDPEAGQFTHFRHDSARPDSLPEDSVYGIAEDQAGQLWVGTQQGLARLDPEADRFEIFTHDPAQPGSLSRNWAFELHRGPKGTLWIGTIGGGINRWNPDDGDFTRFDLAALTAGPESRNDVFYLHEFDNGQVWAGTRAGLVVLYPEGRVAEHIPPEGGDSDPIITSGAVDDRGRLWLTTLDGPLIFDPEKREWHAAMRGEPGTARNLPALPQVSVAIGHELVFIGSWGEGVYRTALKDLPFDLVGIAAGEKALRNRNVTSVLATQQTGTPWVGTFGGGPQRIDVRGDAVFPGSGGPDGINAVGVLDMAPVGNGTYLAAATAGLYQFDRNGVEISYVAHDPGRPDSIGEGYANALHLEEDGGLWLGLGGSGLYYRPPGGRAFRRFAHDPADPDSLSGDFITVLFGDTPGELWVGTRSNGLNRCRIIPWSCERFNAGPGTGPKLPHHDVTALKRDRRGRLWVATTGGGLNRVIEDADGNVTGFEHFGEAQGLLKDGIMAIEEDQDESLWLSTRHGISRFHPDTGRVNNFVTESGLPASHYNTNASSADEDFIYFGSVEGLLSIRKGSLMQERDAAPLQITRVQTAAEQEQPSRVWPEDGRLEVPYGDIITLEFAALDFSESTHSYGYRLRPDDPWTFVGEQHQVIVHGLPPGEYAFQARGRDVFGRWGESETLQLQITPPFWMTNWFRAAVGALLIVLAFLVHRAHLARQQKRSLEIQRLAEARELALESALGNKAELAVLTPRQKEVLQLIAEGHSTRDIAERLNISTKTVETHRANLMERLEIFDVPGLVRLAIRAGLVSSQN